MPKKALLFDADGTLYDFQASEKHALSRLFPSIGIPLTEENTQLYQKANSLCWQEYEAGLIDVPILKEKRFAILASSLGLDIDSKKTGEEYARYLEEKGVLLPGARELVTSLSTDHSLYLITNGFASTQGKRIAASGLDGFFKGLFISETVGAAKPSKAFFDYVLRSACLSPDEALVIGDSETSDIMGARQAGIESIYISFRGKDSALADHSVHSYQELLSLIHDIDKRDIENQI